MRPVAEQVHPGDGFDELVLVQRTVQAVHVEAGRRQDLDGVGVDLFEEQDSDGRVGHGLAFG